MRSNQFLFAILILAFAGPLSAQENNVVSLCNKIVGYQMDLANRIHRQGWNESHFKKNDPKSRLVEYYISYTHKLMNRHWFNANPDRSINCNPTVEVISYPLVIKTVTYDAKEMRASLPDLREQKIVFNNQRDNGMVKFIEDLARGEDNDIFYGHMDRDNP